VSGNRGFKSEFGREPLSSIFGKFTSCGRDLGSSCLDSVVGCCANSLIVPRRLGLATWSDDSGCPDNGSKINDRDLASTASSSPSVNSVPTRLPSRPSRAISTASPIRDSSTSGSYSVTWQRMLSNIHQIPSLRAVATTVLDEGTTKKIQTLNDKVVDLSRTDTALASALPRPGHSAEKLIRCTSRNRLVGRHYAEAVDDFYPGYAHTFTTIVKREHVAPGNSGII
jgi:hypothetical protein